MGSDCEDDCENKEDEDLIWIGSPLRRQSSILLLELNAALEAALITVTVSAMPGDCSLLHGPTKTAHLLLSLYCL